MLNKCGTKVVALQKKTKGLAERDITVEIPGLGFLSTATLAIMKQYHRAIAAVRQVEKELAWIPTVNLTLAVEEDPSLTDKIESLRLLSSEMEVLDLAATGCLSEDTMTTLMTKRFGSDPTRILGNANFVSVNLGSDVVVDRDGLEALFLGASMERAIIPVNCNGNHWSSIMIDFTEHKLFYYDPMDSSYKVGLRAATQVIKSMVPSLQSCTGRVQPYTSTLGVQTDSYNCGIYILATFEIFSGADSPGFVDKKNLQHLRYRYLFERSWRARDYGFPYVRFLIGTGDDEVKKADDLKGAHDKLLGLLTGLAEHMERG
ncbi:hypothetical protein PInf_004782 [Phytophthora infestans]|nr:hypothetical protein PInf_004782 [Phytophthora infestans]